MKKQTQAIHTQFQRRDAYNSLSMPVYHTAAYEFDNADDMADACVFLLENYSGEQHVNIGTGKEVTIKQLAELVKDTVGYSGEIMWNSKMPDGTPRKLTDVTKLHELGWSHKIELEEGVRLAYKWFVDNIDDARK